MNTVTAKLSGSTWAGLSAIAMAVVLMAVCLSSVAMLICHTPATAKRSTSSLCGCGPVCDCPTQFKPFNFDVRRPRDERGQAESPVIVNAAAANELKQQNGCPTCPQVRYPVRRPVQPTYVQPTYTPVQPTYTPVQPTYTPVQPTYTPVQPTAPKPVTPVNPAVVAVNNKCQIALFLDNSPKSAELKNWFESDPGLTALRSKCTFEVYTPENALYRGRYAAIVPVSQFPVVLFQYPNGGHIHAAGQKTIPATAAELYSDMKVGYEKAQSVKLATVNNSGSGVMTRGYNFDTEGPQTNSDCPGGVCPPDNGRWQPGDRVRDLFPAAKDARQLVVWGGMMEIVVYCALAASVVLALMTFVVIVMLVVSRMSRGPK